MTTNQSAIEFLLFRRGDWLSRQKGRTTTKCDSGVLASKRV